jgi:hypothetical protein
MTHDYKRNGTTTLFAALDVKTGEVVGEPGECMPRHRVREFIRFLKKIDRVIANSLDLHLIVDNYKSHMTKKVQAWLAKHLRFKLQSRRCGSHTAGHCFSLTWSRGGQRTGSIAVMAETNGIRLGYGVTDRHGEWIVADELVSFPHTATRFGG